MSGSVGRRPKGPAGGGAAARTGLAAEKRAVPPVAVEWAPTRALTAASRLGGAGAARDPGTPGRGCSGQAGAGGREAPNPWPAGSSGAGGWVRIDDVVVWLPSRPPAGGSLAPNL